MATTNYYTVNGAILGEKTTGGSRIDYLTDPLGSVTATVDQSANVVNTYRYKPYGAQLAKTGAGSDPAFRWVGSQGYRQTGKQFSDVYIRRRHYGSELGRWTTWDPIGNAEGPNRYLYGQNRPTVAIDPTGFLAIAWFSAEDPIQFGVCGDAFWGVKWILSLQEKHEGSIVQHVVDRAYKLSCSWWAPAPLPTNNPSFLEFWELWSVDQKGNIDPSAELVADDMFDSVDEGVGRGGVALTGKVKYLSGYVLNKVTGMAGPDRWDKPGTHPNAPNLWTRRTAPKGWTDAGALDHRLLISYICCQDYKWTQIKTIPERPPGK